MKCEACSANIGPRSEPFGGFLCNNEHLQCRPCNFQNNQQCHSCKDETLFVCMRFSNITIGHRKTILTIETVADDLLQEAIDMAICSSNEGVLECKENPDDHVDNCKTKLGFIESAVDLNKSFINQSSQKSGIEFQTLETNTLPNDFENFREIQQSQEALQDNAQSPKDTVEDLKSKQMTENLSNNPTSGINSLTNPEILTSRPKNLEYIAMPAIGQCLPQSDVLINKDKFGNTSLDKRLQKVLDTLQEDPKNCAMFDKSKPTAFDFTIPILKKSTKSCENFAQDTIGSHIKPESRYMIRYLNNSYHAIYEKTNNFVRPKRCFQNKILASAISQELPTAKFQLISANTAKLQKLRVHKLQFIQTKPLPGCVLKISRQPFHCPETTCQRLTLVSAATQHLLADHSELPMERIASFQCKNFLLDPRYIESGSSKCHFLYLLQDKITDLDNGPYGKYLPVIVMASRLSLQDILGSQHQHFSNIDNDFLIIWLTGINSELFPISVSLSVWPRSGKTPSCHLVYSGQMHSLRSSQSVVDIWHSGNMLSLSAKQVNLLTNNGKEMLNMQLTVH